VLRQQRLRDAGCQRSVQPLPLGHPAKSKRDIIFVLPRQVKVKATHGKQKVA